MIATLLLLSLTAPVPTAHGSLPVPHISHVAPDDFDDELKKAIASYADDLAKVAEWCEKEDWFAEAEQIFEEVLLIDPDNKRARKGLGYKRVRGEWERDEDRKRVRNEERVDLDKLEERAKKAKASQLKRMLKVLDKFEEEVEPERIEAELWTLLDQHSESDDVRRRLGFVKGWEGRPWVMAESKQAKERREEIKKLGRELRERAPDPEAAPVDGWEKELGPKWQGCGRNDRVRAMTSNAASELEDVLEVAWTAQEIMNEVFDMDYQLPADCTVYLMSGKSEVEKFAENWPETDRDRSMWPNVSSTWLGGPYLGVWRDDKTARLDSVSRQMIGQMMWGGFGVSSRQGWIFEGFGLYLSYRVVNTRLSFFIRQTQYTEGGKSNFNSRLRQSRANWFRLAYEALTGEDKPKLVFVLGKDVNQLSPEDLLYGYALAAYILEVHGDKAARILTRIGDEEAPALVLEEELGRKLPELEKHIVRWLDDVRN